MNLKTKFQVIVWLLVLSGLGACRARLRPVGDGAGGGGASRPSDSDAAQPGGETPGTKAPDNAPGDSPLAMDLSANGVRDELQVTPGSNVQIVWSSQGYKECRIPEIEQDTLSGVHDFIPPASMSVTLTCERDEKKDELKVAILLTDQPSVPEASITANDKTDSLTVNTGSDVLIRWTSKGAKSCQVFPVLWEGTSGEKTLKSIQAPANLLLICKNDVGSGEDSVEILVITPGGGSNPGSNQNSQSANQNDDK